MTLPRRLRPTAEQRLRTLTRQAMPGLAAGLSRSLRPVTHSSNPGTVLPDTPAASAAILGAANFLDERTDTATGLVAQPSTVTGYADWSTYFSTDTSELGGVAILQEGLYSITAQAFIKETTADSQVGIQLAWSGGNNNAFALEAFTDRVTLSGGDVDYVDILTISLPMVLVQAGVGFTFPTTGAVLQLQVNGPDGSVYNNASLTLARYA